LTGVLETLAIILDLKSDLVKVVAQQLSEHLIVAVQMGSILGVTVENGAVTED
jgi:hypothetical protein